MYHCMVVHTSTYNPQSLQCNAGVATGTWLPRVEWDSEQGWDLCLVWQAFPTLLATVRSVQVSQGGKYPNYLADYSYVANPPVNQRMSYFMKGCYFRIITLIIGPRQL